MTFITIALKINETGVTKHFYFEIITLGTQKLDNKYYNHHKLLDARNLHISTSLLDICFIHTVT